MLKKKFIIKIAYLMFVWLIECNCTLVTVRYDVNNILDMMEEYENPRVAHNWQLQISEVKYIPSEISESLYVHGLLNSGFVKQLTAGTLCGFVCWGKWHCDKSDCSAETYVKAGYFHTTTCGHDSGKKTCIENCKNLLGGIPTTAEDSRIMYRSLASCISSKKNEIANIFFNGIRQVTESLTKGQIEIRRVHNLKDGNPGKEAILNSLCSTCGIRFRDCKHGVHK